MSREYFYELDAFEVYHKEQQASKSIGPVLPALGHALSGATGAAISNAITYPLQLLITRLQVQRRKQKATDNDEDEEQYKDIFDAIQKIYHNEGGISAFYAGVGQEIAKSVADSFLFFLAYSFLRKARQISANTKKLAASEELGIGMVAGAFSKLFTTPIQNVITRKQIAAMSAKRSGHNRMTVAEIAQQIREEKGWQGFWTGYSATLILTLNPGLTFLLHELFERINRRTANRNGEFATFVLAASSKAVASSVTYPFSLAKSRAQASSRASTDSHAGSDSAESNSLKSAEHKAEAQIKRNTVLGQVLEIAKTEGPTGLYQGLSGEVLKGFFQHGITMLIKDRAFQVIQYLYFALLKLLKRYPDPEELVVLAKERVKQATQSNTD